MAILELPTDKSLPGYKYTITLEGLSYQIQYQFNTRMDKWFMSVSDVLGEVIIGPVPLVANWDLFSRFKDARLPPGVFIAFDTAGTNEDPGRFDLGDRVRVLYQESA